ncbi:MAG: hypothetical protein ACXVX9_11825 [Mycobacteriaceae bacterium]
MSAHSVPAVRRPRATRPHAPRATAIAGLVGLCATGLAVLGAGSASAAPTGPPDLVLNSCNTATQAAPGQRVTLTAQALLAPITTDLNAIPLLGPITLGLLTPVLSAVPLPPFTVQSTPGPQQFSGVDIANQLVSSLKLLLPPGTEGQVRTSVSNGCKVDVNVVAPAAAPTPAHGLAPVPAPAGVPLPGSAATALPVAPSSGLYAPIGNFGYAPEHTYSALTSIPTEGAAAFSTDFAPLPAPAPGVDSSSTSVAGVALSTPTISGMNQVTALPAPPASSRVPVQDVLAALLLALTTATLVRTWVLRPPAASSLGAHRAQREWAPGARFVGVLRGR